MAADDAQVSPDMLQPEIMSREDLITALQEKQLKECDLGEMDKDALIEVYYKSILPLPQRKYRLNRRGSSATKKQIVMAKTRKRTFEKISVGPGESKQIRTQPTGLITSFRLPDSKPPSNRLKPPPVSIEKKIIRLKPKSPDSSSMSGIVIKNRAMDKNNSSLAKAANGSKTEGNNAEGNLQKASPEKSALTDTHRVIKLNRTTSEEQKSTKSREKTQTHSSANESISPKAKKTRDSDVSSNETDTSTEEVAMKKFKKISITWP